MRRGDLFPLARDGLQPVTLPDFREIMGLHPDISRAITRHVQNRNSWVVATIMQSHDEEDRDAITDGVLSQFPEATHQRKRPLIKQDIETIYKVARRVPSIAQHQNYNIMINSDPGREKKVNWASTRLDLPEDIVGFKQVKLEAIPGRHWLSWKPRHIKNQTGENIRDIEAQLRIKWQNGLLDILIPHKDFFLVYGRAGGTQTEHAPMLLFPN